ncbi:MAG: 50S ribosomal protein L9 [Myxococcales bacterium]|nr:50S ribosomal protein L9 [Myxococcales bacterium]MCB9709508.1 50S ribosomal protein L9 [Myxococcales bacterium]
MAANIEVILREDVPKLGKIGEVVRVRRGYARNFLVPRGLGTVATAGSVKQVAHEKQAALSRAVKLRQGAEAIKAALETLTIQIAKPVGEEGKLFGSVTAKDIAEALRVQGQDVDRRKILLDAPIRQVGNHDVSIKLAPDVIASCKVEVAAQTA